jgi:hypothetical protein
MINPRPRTRTNPKPKTRKNPKPKTRVDQQEKRLSTMASRGKAHNSLLKIAEQAKYSTDKRRRTQNTLAGNASIFKMINDEEQEEKRQRQRQDESNNPFTSFNGLKGIRSPPYTERGAEIQKMIENHEKTREKNIKNRSNRHNHFKKIREAVTRRKIKPDGTVYAHPYEKHKRRRSKKVMPPPTILTRSMRRSQEIPVISPVIESVPKKKNIPKQKVRKPPPEV